MNLLIALAGLLILSAALVPIICAWRLSTDQKCNIGEVKS